MRLLSGAPIVTRELRQLQPGTGLFGYLVYLVCLVDLVHLVVSFNQTNETNETNLFFCFGLLAAGPASHHYQGKDGQAREPETRTAIGGIGKLDEVGQSPDQERHAGHHGVAEGRAKGDHQKYDARAGHNFARPRVLDGEKEVEQHRTDADQDDNGVQAAGGIQETPRKDDAFSRHQRQERANRVLDLLQDKGRDGPWDREP